MENIDTPPPREFNGDGDDSEATHSIEEQIDKVLRNVTGEVRLGIGERASNATHSGEDSSGDADLCTIKWDAVVATSDLNNEHLRKTPSPEIENPASASHSTDKSNEPENPAATQYKKQLDNDILNLSHRGIDESELPSINELVVLCEAHFLVLSYNKISTIQTAFPSCLQVLDISTNKLSTLTGKGFKSLRSLVHLDVSNNALTSLEGLEYCQSLETINASYNSIQFVDGLTSLHYKLLEIDISYNQIESMQNLRSLCMCSSLQTLHVRGNPVSFDRSMRHLILHMLPNVRLLDGNKQAPSPRTRASPVMIDFKIKPAPGSAYRPKNVRVSGGGGMSSGKSTTTYAKLYQLNGGSTKKKVQLDSEETVSTARETRIQDTQDKSQEWSKERDRPWATKPLQIHIEPQKTPPLFQRLSPSNVLESVNYRDVDKCRISSNGERGKKSPHPVITIPSSMALPYHYETMKHELEDISREQDYVDTSKLSPKSLLSYLTVEQKLKAEREELNRSTMYEEEFLKSYSETRGRNAASGKGSSSLKKDYEVEQAAWKSITPHRSKYTDDPGRFEVNRNNSPNMEDVPVMKRLNFESSTVASAAKRKDTSHMSRKLVKQKKSAKKLSGVRSRKSNTRLSRRNEKSVHKNISFEGRHSGVANDDKVLDRNCNSLPRASTDEGKQRRKKKKKKGKVNNKKARQNKSLKSDDIRKSKSKTTEPVFPCDVRTNYEALAIDDRINMTIPELMKNAQVGSDKVNLQFDLGDHLESKLSEMIEHKRQTLATLYKKLANDNIDQQT